MVKARGVLATALTTLQKAAFIFGWIYSQLTETKISHALCLLCLLHSSKSFWHQTDGYSISNHLYLTCLVMIYLSHSAERLKSSQGKEWVKNESTHLSAHILVVNTFESLNVALALKRWQQLNLSHNSPCLHDASTIAKISVGPIVISPHLCCGHTC